jgi:hypothetical protein
MKARNDGRATGAAGLFVSGALGLDGTAPSEAARVPVSAFPSPPNR